MQAHRIARCRLPSPPRSALSHLSQDCVKAECGALLLLSSEGDKATSVTKEGVSTRPLTSSRIIFHSSSVTILFFSLTNFCRFFTLSISASQPSSPSLSLRCPCFPSRSSHALAPSTRVLLPSHPDPLVCISFLSLPPPSHCLTIASLLPSGRSSQHLRCSRRLSSLHVRLPSRISRPDIPGEGCDDGETVSSAFAFLSLPFLLLLLLLHDRLSPSPLLSLHSQQTVAVLVVAGRSEGARKLIFDETDRISLEFLAA